MIIIMGSVGSGKTEQGSRLVKKLNCPRISTSQLLREHPERKWHSHIREGRLVNDEDIIDILNRAFTDLGADSTEFILDGAPRSIPQAEWLTEEIKAGRVLLTAVINLKVSDDVVLKRLMDRGREDDQEPVILNRLRDYHAITQPVLKYLTDNEIKVHHIDGENNPDQVEKDINKVLGV